MLVVGAGVSGIALGWKLGQAGIPYTIVDKNERLGGTWWENTYPGARVDVGNHFYCYSFAPNPDWTEFFARQPELQRYFAECADGFGVRDRIRFDTEVTRVVWHEPSARWRIEVRARDGSTETIDATAVVVNTRRPSAFR